MSAPGSDDGRPGGRGSYAKGIARRQEILDRAIEVFAERGSKRTSLRAIASEVGVTHAALTHYFGSLDELLVAVYVESGRRSDAREEPAEESTPAATMRRSAQQNRSIPGLVQLYSSLVAAALEDGHPAPQEFITTRFARLRREMALRVSRLQDDGVIRPDVDPALVAALVIAASDGLQVQWLLDPDVDHEGALAMLDALLSGPGG
ncbi:TetR/AcrR family transcriptional regulator [uncultured Microbacterium sp.]|uniref:TetR/AcrR family transcriptional regulator n=2 Tax=Microbacterium TaxID=33882 RepID=UPI000C5F5FA6|nr:TetR/AcrR family transcriptional regulator [uncultured Microbacterium sp.]MAB19355.1 TetR family transcriptional regulator [Microbacterium sp.]MAM54416.1 TetR family transcriptional regulator [Microbacterium sp.]HAS33543.1 TetR family transcriptional regulator [Microbacterium sp.]|tara:strand:+ start:102 stop:719 length:618 start_codon:yes stop_codon:yes gene_type:complete